MTTDPAILNATATAFAELGLSSFNDRVTACKAEIRRLGHARIAEIDANFVELRRMHLKRSRLATRPMKSSDAFATLRWHEPGATAYDDEQNWI